MIKTDFGAFCRLKFDRIQVTVLSYSSRISELPQISVPDEYEVEDMSSDRKKTIETLRRKIRARQYI
jgi:hypothetical protein